MRHQNSVFHEVLKHVPWGVFAGLVEEHDADRRVRRLTTKAQFVALLYGQLSGAVSLREIVGGLESHKARLYHLGSSSPQRSTLADANARRSSSVFTGLFTHMVGQAHRGLRRALGDAVYLIDSTGLRLSGMGSGWSYFSAHANGGKVHVIYDAHAERPVYATVTRANVNDITAAKSMPIEAGATYVFDLGYYDYAWWSKLDTAGCRIVTRFKSNTKLRDIVEQPVQAGGPVLSDRIGYLPARLARNRRNPFAKPVREVAVETETGKVLRILSNDLKAPAHEIAELYKRRWAIELFFKWIKQTLKLKHFLGNNENAVRIQVAVALIAYLLLRLAQASQTAIPQPLAFARLIRANLMHKKRIDRLLEPEPIPFSNQNQLLLI